jgi:hypothetical protein
LHYRTHQVKSEFLSNTLGSTPLIFRQKPRFMQLGENQWVITPPEEESIESETGEIVIDDDEDSDNDKKSQKTTPPSVSFHVTNEHKKSRNRRTAKFIKSVDPVIVIVE